MVKPPIDVVDPTSHSLKSKTSFVGDDAAIDGGMYSLESNKHRRRLKIIIAAWPQVAKFLILNKIRIDKNNVQQGFWFQKKPCVLRNWLRFL